MAQPQKTEMMIKHERARYIYLYKETYTILLFYFNLLPHGIWQPTINSWHSSVTGKWVMGHINETTNVIFGMIATQTVIRMICINSTRCIDAKGYPVEVNMQVVFWKIWRWCVSLKCHFLLRSLSNYVSIQR